METYSLERSFRAFSINDAGSAAGSSPEDNAPSTLELNSHLSLPYQWEQFLDLKTGEVYYIDWRSGRKSKGDPRRLQNSRRGEGDRGTDYEAGGEQEEEADEGDDLEEEKEGDEEYEGGESENGSCSSSCSSTEDYLEEQSIQHDDVLVVAGCKRCLMYFMLPKITDECPKCSSLLLHFNGSESTLL